MLDQRRHRLIAKRRAGQMLDFTRQLGIRWQPATRHQLTSRRAAGLLVHGSMLAQVARRLRAVAPVQAGPASLQLTRGLAAAAEPAPAASTENGTITQVRWGCQGFSSCSQPCPGRTLAFEGGRSLRWLCRAWIADIGAQSQLERPSGA